MALGWNAFNSLQFAGFVVLLLGTLIYNHIIVIKALEPGPEASALKITNPELAAAIQDDV